MSLKKSDISKNISSSINLSESLSKDILNSFIDIIKSRSATKNVKIPNFGTFSNKTTPQRMGRNPKTGQKFLITKRKKLNFVVSKKIREYLN